MFVRQTERKRERERERERERDMKSKCRKIKHGSQNNYSCRKKRGTVKNMDERQSKYH